MISPDFLFTSAWEYQVKLQEFQEKINAVVHAVIVAVSEVLEGSTAETLKQYEDHVNVIEKIYAPSLKSFEGLKPGSCRNSAETILNQTTLFTGFKASNCAYTYNSRVTTEVNDANKALVRFDDVYTQVQSIVVKAFVGSNVFLTPEDIQEKFIEIYKLVTDRWEETEPEIEAVKRNLQTRITNQNVELGRCHGEIETETEGEYKRFRDMVKVCEDFDTSRGDRSDSNFNQHEKMLEDFMTEHAKLKTYEWTA